MQINMDMCTSFHIIAFQPEIVDLYFLLYALYFLLNLLFKFSISMNI